jgi:hypothetical protein
MDDLVERLSNGTHPVELTLRPDRTIDILKEQLDRGFVHVKFTGTRGGTELGVRLDQQACDFSHANLEDATGTLKLSGGLVLNYVRVKCVAEIDVATFSGAGRLEPIEEVSLVPAGVAETGV